MKNLKSKSILNGEKNNKKQSVFDNSEVVLNILYSTYKKNHFIKNKKLSCKKKIAFYI